jgi:O-antigen ligase
MIEIINLRHQSSLLQRLGYLFVASMPLTNIKFYGHLYLFEAFAAILLFLVLFFFATGFIKFKMNFTDYCIIAFAFFSLISVATNIDSPYIAMRHYRHMVLVPTLVYFLIRCIFVEINSTKKSNLVLVIITVFFVGSVLVYYFKTGLRPEAALGIDSLITASMLMAFAVFYFYYHIRYMDKLLSKSLLLIILLFLIAGLVVTMTRVAIYGVIIIPLILRISLNRKYFQRIFIYTFVLGNIVVILIAYLFFNPSQTYFDPNIKQKTVELEREIDRITNKDSLEEDIKLRFKKWGYIINFALEKPIFGHGGTFYRYSKGGRSSAHNIFISSFVTNGIFGITLLFIIYISAWKNIFSVSNEDKSFKILHSFIFCSMLLTLLIGMTNDFTGERTIFFFWVIALSGNLHEYYDDNHQKNIIEK